MPSLSVGAALALCSVQYRNDSAETTVAEEGQSQVVGLLGQPSSGSLQ